MPMKCDVLKRIVFFFLSLPEKRCCLVLGIYISKQKRYAWEVGKIMSKDSGKINRIPLSLLAKKKKKKVRPNPSA